jgi:hypothetical protein
MRSFAFPFNLCCSRTYSLPSGFGSAHSAACLSVIKLPRSVSDEAPQRGRTIRWSTTFLHLRIASTCILQTRPS